MEGWIKLHRKIKDNPIYKNSKALHCWIECLLRANHTREVVYIGRKRIVLEPGQFITGREKFAEAVNMSPTTVWFWINSFKVDSMIDIKTTNKYSVISIKNWNKYQNLDSKVDSKKTAKRQQKDTDNNDKNDNKILSKDNMTQVSFGNPRVNLILETFKNTFNKQPLESEKKARFVAGTFKRNIEAYCRKAFGREISDEEYEKFVRKIFEWYEKQDFPVTSMLEPATALAGVLSSPVDVSNFHRFSPSSDRP